MTLHALLRTALTRGLAPARSHSVAESEPRRLLLVRPDHLGDLLLTTPAITHLRATLPAAHLTLLVGPWNADAASRLAGVDEVLTLPFPYFDRRPKRGPLAPYTLLRTEANRLAGLRFDTAVVFRHDHWWGAALAARAGIPRRLGWAHPEASVFLTQAVEHPPQHEAARALVLSEALTGLTATRRPPMGFRPTGEDVAAAAGWLAASGVGDRFVAIHPGSGGAVKLWAAERWSMVADALRAQYGVAVIVTGSAAEADLVRQVGSGCRESVAVPLTGIGVGQLGATLATAGLVLGPDSGVLHLAESTGAATVRLFGPAPVERFGPWQLSPRHQVVRSRLACVACGRLDFPAEVLAAHPCVRAIGLEQVLAAAGAALSAIDGEH